LAAGEYEQGALFNSKSDFDLLQNAIDYLTCKARLKMAFTDEERGFLKAIYEDFAVGGRVKGYPEAAELIDHYVDGKGAKLQIDETVYQTSVIVQDTSEAIKHYIRQQIAQRAISRWFALPTPASFTHRKGGGCPGHTVATSKSKGTFCLTAIS
jgi:hypothetical protein